MRRLIAILLGAALLAIGYVYGVLSQRFELFPYHHLIRFFDARPFGQLASYGGYDVTFDRTRVTCADIPRDALVLVTFGQSNAANSGDGSFGPVPSVYNFNALDGRCYEARDPLLGAGGSGSAVWIPLAQQLIEAGEVRAVVIAPIAMGGTQVADWAPGDGRYAGRLGRAVEGLQSAGMPVHALLWHQGESDHGTGTEGYVRSFLRMREAIRQLDVTAPIYVARASYCNGVMSPEVRAAQEQLARARDDVRPGPDTDVLAGDALRSGCHFTQLGTLRHAALWFDSLAADVSGMMRTGVAR